MQRKNQRINRPILSEETNFNGILNGFGGLLFWKLVACAQCEIKMRPRPIRSDLIWNGIDISDLLVPERCELYSCFVVVCIWWSLKQTKNIN